MEWWNALRARFRSAGVQPDAEPCAERTLHRIPPARGHAPRMGRGLWRSGAIL